MIDPMIDRYIEIAVATRTEVTTVSKHFKAAVRIGDILIAHMGTTEVEAMGKVMQDAITNKTVREWVWQEYVDRGRAFLKSLDELIFQVAALSARGGMKFLRFDLPGESMEQLRTAIDLAHTIVPVCTHPIQQMGEFRFTYQGVEIRVIKH